MRLLESAVSPEEQVSAPGCSFSCVFLQCPAHAELNHLPPFPLVWAYCSPTHSMCKKALLPWTKCGKPKGSHCFGSCTNQQTLRGFPKVPLTLCPLTSSQGWELEQPSSNTNLSKCSSLRWAESGNCCITLQSVFGTSSPELLSPSMAGSYWKPSLSAGHLHLFTAQLLPLV